MFEAWFAAFLASGNETMLDSSVTTGDNGTPVKDLGYLMKKVVTADNKIRIVITT